MIKNKGRKVCVVVLCTIRPLLKVETQKGLLLGYPKKAFIACNVIITLSLIKQICTQLSKTRFLSKHIFRSFKTSL